MLTVALSLSAPAAAVLLWKKRREKSGLALLWLLCAVSLLGTLLAGAVVQIRMREIYLFLWYLLDALSLIPVLEALGEKGRRAALALLCLLSLGNLLCSYGSSLYEAQKRVELQEHIERENERKAEDKRRFQEAKREWERKQGLLKEAV